MSDIFDTPVTVGMVVRAAQATVAKIDVAGQGVLERLQKVPPGSSNLYAQVFDTAITAVKTSLTNFADQILEEARK